MDGPTWNGGRTDSDRTGSLTACFRNNEYSRIQTGGAKDTQGFSGSDNLFLVGLKIPKGSPVRVVFVTCHDKRYSLSVLLPLMIKPPDLWVESWKFQKEEEVLTRFSKTNYLLFLT